MPTNASENMMSIDLLLVDDNDLDIKIAMKAFEFCKKTQIRIHTAKGGEEALDFLTQGGNPRPHMVLLDINMPKISGIEVLDQIKNNKALKDIPVIMLTSSNSEDDMRVSYKHHANAFVTKAADFDDMVRFANNIEEFWFLSATLPQEED